MQESMPGATPGGGPRSSPMPGPSLIAAFVIALLVLVSCTESFSPRPVGSIKLLPDTANLEPGQTSVHEMRVLDDRGEPLPGDRTERIVWTVSDTSLASIQTDGTNLRVTAKAVGAVVLRAALGDARRSFRVWVRRQGLARIEMEPSPLVVSSGGIRGFTTRLYDEQGQEMPHYAFRLSWRVADEQLATVQQETAVANQVRLVGNAAAQGSGGLSGTTKVLAIVSGVVQGFDLRITLEPTPHDAAPTVEVVSSSSLRITWRTDYESDTGYEIERADGSEGPWAHVAFTGAGAFFPRFDTTYVDTGLPANAARHYRIRSCNEFGCSVEPSPVGAGTTSAAQARQRR